MAPDCGSQRRQCRSAGCHAGGASARGCGSHSRAKAQPPLLLLGGIPNHPARPVSPGPSSLQQRSIALEGPSCLSAPAERLPCTQVAQLDSIAARARFGRWLDGEYVAFVPFPKHDHQRPSPQQQAKWRAAQAGSAGAALRLPESPQVTGRSRAPPSQGLQAARSWTNSCGGHRPDGGPLLQAPPAAGARSEGCWRSCQVPVRRRGPGAPGLSAQSTCDHHHYDRATCAGSAAH